MDNDNPYEPYMDSIIHRLTTNEDLEYVIHRLTFDEDSNTTQNCLFCPSEIHRFKDCPIFNDEQFKSTLLVKLMSEYNRTRRRLEKKNPPSRTPISRKFDNFLPIPFPLIRKPLHLRRIFPRAENNESLSYPLFGPSSSHAYPC